MFLETDQCPVEIPGRDRCAHNNKPIQF